MGSFFSLLCRYHGMCVSCVSSLITFSKDACLYDRRDSAFYNGKMEGLENWGEWKKKWELIRVDKLIK